MGRPECRTGMELLEKYWGNCVPWVGGLGVLGKLRMLEKEGLGELGRWGWGNWRMTSEKLG